MEEDLQLIRDLSTIRTYQGDLSLNFISNASLNGRQKKGCADERVQTFSRFKGMGAAEVELGTD